MYQKLITRLLAVTFLSVVATVTPAQTQPVTYSLDIPAQDLNSALQEFALASRHRILFKSDLVEGCTSPALRGEFTMDEAVRRLLGGTALTYEITPSEVVLIRQKGEKSAVSNGIEKDAAFRLVESNANEPVTGATTEIGSQSGTAPVSLPSSDEGRLQEVVVTAQKRAERLLEVPVSVSAISGSRLESLGVNSLTDLANYVPGLTLNSSGSPGFRVIALRGISTGNTDFTGPTVGMYIDDSLIGSSTSGGRGNTFGLDLNPFDVERIEVLKGPQGTLYGGNSLGGLIKYTMQKPDLTEFAARFAAGLRSINQSGDTGWDAHATLNVPIATDSVALRLSGFLNRTPGYIDNVRLGVKDANRSTESGGRAALLWRLSERLSVQAVAMLQDIDVKDQSDVYIDAATGQPINGPQTGSAYFLQPYSQYANNYAVTVNWDLGFANLVNAAGWSRIKGHLGEDLETAFTGPTALSFFDLDDKVSKVTEELRLASPESHRVQWLLGGYFTRENTEELNSIPAYTLGGVRLPDSQNVFIDRLTSTFKETAVFGNLTYKVTDRFDIGAGERYSHYVKSTGCEFSQGLFGSGQHPCQFPPAKNVSTWMGNARLHLNRDAMLYARVATGYRPGATNTSFSIVTSGGAAPLEVNPDRTTNYELGYKAQLLDRRLQIEASVFRIDWKDLQTQVQQSSTSTFVDNAGSAVSQGVELTLGTQLARGWRSDATVAYTDAHFTEDTSAGKNGDPLPLAARWTGSLTTDYERQLNERVMLLLGGGYRHRAVVTSNFSPVALPEQNIVDLYAGVGLKRAVVRLDLRNAFLDRSYTGVAYTPIPTRLRFIPVLPRMIELSVDYRF